MEWEDWIPVRAHSDEEIDCILEELAALEKPAPPLSAPPRPPEKSGWKQELWSWVCTFAGTAAVVFLVFYVLFRIVEVQGHSMDPTLQSGDRLVISGLFYDPKPGDIVVTTDENGLNEPLVKRVIAVGGQMLEIQNGCVYLNGEKQEELYLNGAPTFPGDTGNPVQVPEGCVFLMGDNRTQSIDSRYSQVGLLPENEIMGRVLFRMLPLSRAGTVR